MIDVRGLIAKGNGLMASRTFPDDVGVPDNVIMPTNAPQVRLGFFFPGSPSQDERLCGRFAQTCPTGSVLGLAIVGAADN